MTLLDLNDALGLLHSLDAHPWLVRHHELVAETAQELLTALRHALPALEFDRQEVVLGAALHDVGKTRHPEEMSGPGAHHELAGEELLLASGVAPRVARHARLHARWSDAPDLEVLLVALADKLWKGRRVESLEVQAVDVFSGTLGQDRWEVFVAVDAVFEAVAAGADQRLRRSDV